MGREKSFSKIPVRLANGNLVVPMRAEGENGMVGDGAVEIGPEHPQFEVWDDYLRRMELSSPSK